MLSIMDLANLSARHTHLNSAEIERVYEQLTKINKKPNIPLETIEQVLNMIKQKKWTLNDYLEFTGIHFLGDETSKAYDDEVRKKLGWTKPEWAKVQLFEANMKVHLEVMLRNMLADSMLTGKDPENPEYQSMVARYKTMWGNYCRLNIIGKYPRTKNLDESGKKIRTRITGLLLEKWDALMADKPKV